MITPKELCLFSGDTGVPFEPVLETPHKSSLRVLEGQRPMISFDQVICFDYVDEMSRESDLYAVSKACRLTIHGQDAMDFCNHSLSLTVLVHSIRCEKKWRYLFPVDFIQFLLQKGKSSLGLKQETRAEVGKAPEDLKRIVCCHKG